MVTLCTAQDVKDRCGISANSTIIASSAIIERYIGTSENTICAETRMDWIDDYANVPTEVKETLRECAASDAAIKIISYDMRGFSPRQEATTMLNVCYNNFTRTLNALKQIDIVKIRDI